MAEVHPYREHNHDIQDYLQRYYQVPKQPKKHRSLRRENNCKLDILVLEHLHLYYLIIERKQVRHLHR